MLLMAYGSTQSDLLQLHRPETCYPAFGYRISRSAVASLDFSARDLLVRELIVVGTARTESILYWTRERDALHKSNSAHRSGRLRMEMGVFLPNCMHVQTRTDVGKAHNMCDMVRYREYLHLKQ